MAQLLLLLLGHGPHRDPSSGAFCCSCSVLLMLSSSSSSASCRAAHCCAIALPLEEQQLLLHLPHLPLQLLRALTQLLQNLCSGRGQLLLLLLALAESSRGWWQVPHAWHGL
jgi:hypothetical protein